MSDDSNADETRASEAQIEEQAVPEQTGDSSASLSPQPDGDHKPSFVSTLYANLHNFISSLRVRYKIAGIIILILCMAIVSLGIVTISRQTDLLKHEMSNRAGIMVQQLANVGKECLLTKQELPVFSTITDIRKGQDVVYAMVMDDEGRVFSHSDLKLKGTQLSDKASQLALKAETFFIQDTVLNGEPVLDVTLPIILKAKNLKIGTARIGLSERTLRKAIRAQKITFLWIGLVFVVCGLLISFAFAGLLTRPIDSLTRGIQAVAKGDLSVQVAVHYQDEIGKLTEVFNQMILDLREKLHMEKYLSESTVRSIKKHRDLSTLKLGGERKYVTALFSDVRGFTSLSEKMSPEEVVGLLNIYLNLQAKVVHEQGGSVDKFVGDEVMAIFEGRGNEINAVRAAIEIQRYCQTLNKARSASGERQINIGIGLNSGEVVMGNMGSEDHMDYTVIGDNINIAARLCSIAKAGQVLITKTIADAIGDEATWNGLDPVLVKGKDQPVSIFEVVDIKGGSRRYMRQMTDVATTYCLEGFSDVKNKAVAKNISPSGCLLEVPIPVGVGSKLNMEMDLLALGNIKVRATVHHARKQDSLCYIGLCFDDMQEESMQRIIHWMYRVDSEITNGHSA